jgi:hypothetical protein
MMRLRAGELVEVRSKEEILATLDKSGRLDGLPFMPQMFGYCGKQFKVYKRAHKTCDFVYTMSSRWLPDGVHLDLRCDGSAYGGCQHDCLIWWKEAWLKRVEDKVSTSKNTPLPLRAGATCTEADVLTGTSSVNQQGETIYTCQATEVLDFTTPLPWWDFRQYLEDYTSGNVTIGRLVSGFIYASFSTVKNSGLKIGLPLRWLYDSLARIFGFPRYPRRPGLVPDGQTTPTLTLNLQPGELVRVKSYEEILATLDSDCNNRGLYFDAELVPYCGKVFRVKSIVNTFLDEKTRKLRKIKNRCIILEDVACQGRYSQCRMLCPRSILSWWREIWLERVPEGTQLSVATHGRTLQQSEPV